MIPSERQSALKHVLQKYWGYHSFLPLQEEAMEAVLVGQDSVVVLPTGGGKSLCFQAPALVLDGLAVVVSPVDCLDEGSGRRVDFLRGGRGVCEQHHGAGRTTSGSG